VASGDGVTLGPILLHRWVALDAMAVAVAVSGMRYGAGWGLGLGWLGVCASPLKGPAGNVEFLAYWEKT
jgi:hypothetical protein